MFHILPLLLSLFLVSQKAICQVHQPSSSISDSEIYSFYNSILKGKNILVDTSINVSTYFHDKDNRLYPSMYGYNVLDSFFNRDDSIYFDRQLAERKVFLWEQKKLHRTTVIPEKKYIKFSAMAMAGVNFINYLKGQKVLNIFLCRCFL